MVALSFVAQLLFLELSHTQPSFVRLVPIYTHVSNLQLRRVESNKARLSLVSYDANSSRDCVILSSCKFIFGVKLVLCFVHAMFLSTQALKA